MSKPSNIFRLALLAAVLPAVAGKLYKWVDEDGNVHYSDSPVEGAEAVDLPEPTTFDAPRVSPRPARPAPEEDPSAAFGYTEFEFISPKQDQVFWATGGEIPVQLDLVPPLQPGHELNLYFNGELTPDSPLAGLGTTLTGVYRGAHTIRAVIVGPDGEEIAATETVTFHVKQRSIANPRRGN